MSTVIAWPIACLMMKVFSFLFFIWASTTFACELKSETVSLSAPITGVLEDLKLLSDKNLIAISMFHPLKDETKIERLGGGLFLSQKSLKRFQKMTIFFDESGEMKRRLTEAHIAGVIEVQTRSLDPFEVVERAIVKLTPYLKNCDDKLSALKTHYLSEKDWLLQQTAFKNPMYFFLGELKENNWPDLLMVQDGPVLFWLKHKKIKTIESPLAYVRWGEKWKKSLTKEDQLIGLIHSSDTKKFSIEKQTYWNVTSAGALTPGPWQIRFMRQFVEQWKN